MSGRANRRLGAAVLLLALAAAAVRLVPGTGASRGADGQGLSAEDWRLGPGAAATSAAAADAAAAATAGAGRPRLAAPGEAMQDPAPASGAPLPSPEVRPIGWPSYADADQRFAEEPLDPSWSASAEARILGNLPLIPDLVLLDAEVECRQSLCRVRLLFPADASTSLALRRIYALAGDIGLGPLAASPDFNDGGLPSLRLFLRRNER